MIKLALLAIIAATAFAACPGDEFCAQCSTDNKCNLCVNAYADANGLCQQGDGETVEHCYSFATKTTCASCNEGYYLKSNLCHEITIENCVDVDSEDTTKCTLCSNGKIAKDGKCVDGADCAIDGCDYCVTATECAWCKKDYSLTEELKCIKDPISNCMTSALGLCASCERGYYDAGTECKKTGVQGSSVIISAFVSLMAVMKLYA